MYIFKACFIAKTARRPGNYIETLICFIKNYQGNHYKSNLRKTSYELAEIKIIKFEE